MDAGVKSKDGFVFVLARTDDVINVAGHRLSTSALEESLSEVPDVVESAVIGLPDPLKGQVPLAFVVLKQGVTTAREVVAQRCVEHVRKSIGPVAVLKKVLVVQKLPKTRSGKIARNTLAAQAASRPFKVPSTPQPQPRASPDFLSNFRASRIPFEFLAIHQ